MLTLVFDAIVNQAMQLGWSDADVKKYAAIFEEWNQGFTIFANPMPWSKFKKGMRARWVRAWWDRWVRGAQDARTGRRGRTRARRPARAVPPPAMWAPFPGRRSAPLRREVLIERFRQSLRDPSLPAGSIPAVLRDKYGPDSPVCSDTLCPHVLGAYKRCPTTSLQGC